MLFRQVAHIEGGIVQITSLNQRSRRDFHDSLATYATDCERIFTCDQTFEADLLPWYGVGTSQKGHFGNIKKQKNTVSGGITQEKFYCRRSVDLKYPNRIEKTYQQVSACFYALFSQQRHTKIRNRSYLDWAKNGIRTQKSFFWDTVERKPDPAVKTFC